MDWRNGWCRLCGNTETILKVEPEIVEVASKLDVNIYEIYFLPNSPYDLLFR